MSAVSYTFPSAGRSYGVGSGLKIDGFINSPDEITALNILLKSVFPKSTSEARNNIIKDMACGAYSSKATKPEVNAIMTKLMRSLREGQPTSETIDSRNWLRAELLRANPGKTLDDIFKEVCTIRYDFVRGTRDPYPYEMPTLARISNTLYSWDYLSTLVSKPVLDSLKTTELATIGKQIHDKQTLTIAEVKTLITAAIQEKKYILSLPAGKETYPTRLSKIDELLQTIQGITLLSIEQLLSAEK